MGIINKDAFTTRYGLELTNTYISLGNNHIELRKERELKNRTKDTVDNFKNVHRVEQIGPGVFEKSILYIKGLFLKKPIRYNNVRNHVVYSKKLC